MRRVLVLAMVLAACGDSFSLAPDGGGDGGGGGIDAAADASHDSGRGDAAGEDGAVTDATTFDVAPPPPVEAGPPLCQRTCPVGFDCGVASCIDQAALHFAPANNPGLQSNWSYGWESGQGSTFHLDTAHWKASQGSSTSIEFWSKTADSIEASVFKNGLSATTYDGMAIGSLALGMVPGAGGEVSVLRWVPPEAGTYTITATFTGISTPSSKVTVGVSVNNFVGQGTSLALNQFGGGNTFDYAPGAQALDPSKVVDFYVVGPLNLDDVAGGVEVSVKIVSQ
jgi:hypothetical protein